MKHLTLVIIAAAILFACKGKQKSEKSAEAFSPGDKELAVAQKTWPNTTLEELKEGNSIYRNQCTECHKNFEITKFSEKKWKHEIDEMAPKAKLTAEQKDKLTKFILSYREANTVTK